MGQSVEETSCSSRALGGPVQGHQDDKGRKDLWPCFWLLVCTQAEDEAKRHGACLQKLAFALPYIACKKI